MMILISHETHNEPKNLQIKYHNVFLFNTKYSKLKSFNDFLQCNATKNISKTMPVKMLVIKNQRKKWKNFFLYFRFKLKRTGLLQKIKQNAKEKLSKVYYGGTSFFFHCVIFIDFFLLLFYSRFVCVCKNVCLFVI